MRRRIYKPEVLEEALAKRPSSREAPEFHEPPACPFYQVRRVPAPTLLLLGGTLWPVPSAIVCTTLGAGAQRRPVPLRL